jgi:endonuclease YncB( thermonuclease family)
MKYISLQKKSIQMKYLLYLALFLCCTASEVLTGKVVKVVDGDTITILLDGNRQEKNPVGGY